MMKAVVLVGALVVVITSYGNQFLYPIASYLDTDNKDKFLVMYQKNSTHLELWSWDPETRIALPLLPAFFVPAGVRMLPNNTGFSFIDNGRIRIKEFIKRSPRSVVLPYVSNIGLITWSSNGLGYFHAKEHQSYRIYALTPGGDVSLCIMRAQTDCMYPVWQDGELFYIERACTGDSRINATYEYVVVAQHDNTRCVCADFQNRPLMFLSMMSQHEGFVIEHAAKIDAAESAITFVYHHLVRDGTHRWHTHALFSFSIPSALLQDTNEDRLYESIIPLLPRVHGRTVFYVDLYAGNQSLAVYTYNLNTHKQGALITPFSSHDYMMVPFCSEFLAICGGSIKEETQSKGNAPWMYEDEIQGICYFSFPTVSLGSYELT